MNYLSKALSPFADPVVAAIFSDAKHAGLAAASLIRAVLTEDNITIGKVISVISQKAYLSKADKRGCRVDIKIETETHEVIMVEVQIYREAQILERDLLSASLVFSNAVPKGTKAKKLPAYLPKVIVINILEKNIRKDNTEVIQPIKLLYTKEPKTVAMNYFSVYNIQLERFRKKGCDFNNSLDCWLYAMDYAANNNITIKEVIHMTPALQQYAKTDPGFVQYVDRYQIAVDDDSVRNEYNIWLLGQIREEGIRLGAIEEGMEIGIEKGMEKGMEQGIEQGKLQIAANMLKDGLDLSSIAKYSNLSLEAIERLAKEINQAPEYEISSKSFT